MRRLIRPAPLCGVIVLVLLVRLLPVWLTGAEPHARRLADAAVSGRVALELQTSSPAAVDPEQLSAAIEEWKARHGATYDALLSDARERVASELRHAAPNGREYPYLGDFDSYLWMRHARNYLEHGTTCDAVIEGQCRDELANAPLGAPMLYARSLHIAAIAGLHRVLTVFDPDRPLGATSLLVPVILGTLVVVPAFAIGSLLAGRIGGVVTALFIALHAPLIGRSAGADNDVWNVLLPVTMVWAAMMAFRPREGERRPADAGSLIESAWRPRTLDLAAADRLAGWAFAAGVFAMLHAITWSGWLFFYYVVLAALTLALLMATVAARRDASRTPWGDSDVRAVAIAAVAFVLGTTGLSIVARADAALTPFSGLAASAWEWHEALWRTLGLGAAAETAAPGVAATATLLPSTFSFVSELGRVDVGMIAASSGGAPFLVLALLGILLLLLPRGGWTRTDMAIFGAAGLAWTLLAAAGPFEWRSTMTLLAGPVAAAAVRRCWLGPRQEAISVAPALVVAVWAVAAFHVALDGIRFVLLLGPPLGIGLGVIASRAVDHGRQVAPSIRRAAMPRWVVPVAVLAATVPALRPGVLVAATYTPRINDAWWLSLEHLRETSSREAIVNAWWDYGHWIKYVADRRVIADGANLSTHVSYWLSKAFITPDEREMLGLLRMLNCGSDSAHGALMRAGLDEIAAHDLLLAGARASRHEAAVLMTRAGVSAADLPSILSLTHCHPPEAYLVLSTGQLFPPDAWLHFGLWDPRRAYVARQARQQPGSHAVDAVAQRLALPRDDAAALVRAARRGSQPEDLERFIAPREGYLSPGWLPCTRSAAEVVSCRAHLRTSRGDAALESFTFAAGAPQEGRVHVRRGGVGREGTPGLVVDAGAELREHRVASATDPQLGVLVDTRHLRMLVGHPALLRSMFVQLTHLDGRYAAHFEKRHDRTAYTTERVVTWRIRW